MKNQLGLSCILFFFLSISSVTSYPSSYFIPNLPYDRQLTVYECGVASLQMLFNYWSPEVAVTSYQLANIARSCAASGTSGKDVVRSGLFSSLSRSLGLDYPLFSLLHGIPGKPLGYASFGYDGEPWLDDLKESIASNIPIIILMKYSLNDTGGHYRVAFGYDDSSNQIYLHDPWGRDNQPHNVSFTYDDFISVWNYTERGEAEPGGPFYGVMMSPFQFQSSVAPHPNVENRLVIKAMATYPILSPFTLNINNTNRVASNTLFSLYLSNPLNFSVLYSSLQSTNTGTLPPGEYIKNSWEVDCFNGCSNFSATLEVRGIVSGHVPFSKWQHTNKYPPYDYVDVIGGQQIISFN